MSQLLSPVEIASLAAQFLGDKAFTTFGETPTSRFLDSLFETGRDGLLQMYPWKFAIRRQQLAKLSQAPVSLGTTNAASSSSQREDLPNANAFGLPTDYLRIIETSNDPNPWKIENVIISGTGVLGDPFVYGNGLITDDDRIVVRYIARLEDSSQWTSLFAWALAAYLAMESALPTTGSLNKLKAMEELFQRKIQDARTANSFDSAQDKLESRDLTTDVR